MPTNKDIIRLCKEAIALGDKATKPPWKRGSPRFTCTKTHKDGVHGGPDCTYTFKKWEGGQLFDRYISRDIPMKTPKDEVKVVGPISYDIGGVMHQRDSDFICHARNNYVDLAKELLKLLEKG